MIPAIAQTVANFLVAGTSLTSTDQIDFSHPSFDPGSHPRLNLYFYEIQVPKASLHGSQSRCIKPSYPDPPDERHLTLTWLDVIFLLIARDHTPLGEQSLLSETLVLLLQYQSLPDEFLAPPLRGYGALPMRVSTITIADTPAFWSAIGIPLRPALQLTVTAPFQCSQLKTPAEANTVLPT